MDVLNINQDTKIKDVLSLMVENPENFGMAIIVDDNDQFLGVITLGDISRLLIKNSEILNEPLEIYFNKKPIYFYNPIKDEEVILKIKNETISKKIPRYVPILNKQRKVERLVDTYRCLSKSFIYPQKISIVGLGFVGITLALALAGKNQYVIGYDNNKEIIKELNNGKSHVNEPGINSLIKKSLEEQKLILSADPNMISAEVHIICVGTPVNSEKNPDITFLLNALKDISRILEKGNLVIIRSTVSIGTTRNEIIPKLEEYSGMKVGKDIFVSFSPERTVQGNALYEIENLPQLVSGSSPDCLRKAIEFWRIVTNSVVQMDSLEACEIAKLANNAYRDLTFAFSNGISQICANYQIDSSKLISSINEGYPRSFIPKPSPGVGGYCLTKDPYILSSSDACPIQFRNVLNNSREVNDLQIDFLKKHLDTFVENKNLKFKDLEVLVIGLAFKGIPETNDIRNSTSIDLISKIKNQVKKIHGYDNALKSIDDNLGINFIKDINQLKETVNNSSVVFVMNNNPSNIHEDFLSWLKKDSFLCDPWNMFTSFDVVNKYKVSYSNLGKLDLFGF